MNQRGVVGRDRELAELERFLGGERSPSAVLLLEGEPGVGKSTLWEAGVAFAEERGMRVLRCRPSAAESRLSFAALTDLLDEVLDELVPLVAAPRARALEAALLRGDGGRADPRGVALGVLEGLRALAAERAVLVAVDDWQWLDPASEAALTFAIRRLGSEPVRVLCSARPGSDEPPGAVEAARRLEVRPLDPTSLHTLLRVRVGLALSRPALLRIHGATRGNPFFALQIGQALLEKGADVRPDEPLPVPADLETLLSARLKGVDPPVKSLLRLVAVTTAPTATALEEVLGSPGRAREALAAAEAAGLVRLEGESVRFEHPLIASAVLKATPATQLRELHATAARLADEPEERARHLAHASAGPDAAVGAELDAAADHAASRGAYQAAAELCQLALRSTPPSDEEARFRRALAAADRHQRAGDGARARVVLEELVDSLPAGPPRATALSELAAVMGYESDRNVALAAQALEEAGEEPGLLARIHYNLAEIRGSRGELELSERHAREAVEHARAAGDGGLLADALAVLGMALADNGRGPQPDLLSEALEAAARGRTRFPEDPELSFGTRLLRLGEIEQAAPLVERALEKALASDDMVSQCRALSVMGEMELRRGDWERADSQSAEGLALAEQIETENMESFALYRRALVEAHLGRIDEARAHGRRGLELSRAGDRYHHALHESVLGFAALSAGEADAAASHLAGLPDWIRSNVPHDPHFLPVRALAAEALTGVGEPGRAAELTAELESDAERSGHAWGLALAARCRATALAAEGDLEAALEESERALARHADVPIPFDLARTVLVHGVLQRRAKRKRPARETLERAARIFEELGAPLWHERARTELGRIGGRQPATEGTLTATERRVAELAAAGRSNKQIAADLYLSERTVEANLTKVYRKLGLRSRTELAGSWPDAVAGSPGSA